MKLNITSARSIEDLQQDFNAAYPFLKLEFYRMPAKTNSMLTHSLKIKDARRMQYDGIIELQDSMKVHDLENELKEKYGLNAQVFRKSGKVWLETTRSDSWTLKQQNDHGREISATF
jgi:polyphosphate kinase